MADVIENESDSWSTSEAEKVALRRGEVSELRPSGYEIETWKPLLWLYEPQVKAELCLTSEV